MQAVSVRRRNGDRHLKKENVTSSIRINGNSIATPFIWLAQSVDTSVLTARVPSMRSWPTLVSLGDAFRRPKYVESHFNKNLRQRLGISGPIMLDSGGFVLMTRDNPQWTPLRVAEIYEQVDADILVSLDLPPMSNDSTYRRRRKKSMTLYNYQLLTEKLGPKRLMPVIHGHSRKQVVAFCDAVRKIRLNPNWVGIGGMVPLLKQIGSAGTSTTKGRLLHLADTISKVRENFPSSHIHVFGAGAPRSCLWVFANGATSADSHSWRQAAGFGSIFLPAKGQRILQWTRSSRQPRPIIDDDDRNDIANCLCPYCDQRTLENRIEQLTHDFEARSIHNLWTLAEEVKLFRSALQQDRHNQFLESRLSRASLQLIQEQPHRFV